MFQERVLVTGIAGFVGRYLAKLLTAAGCCVFGTVLSSAEVPSDRPIPGVDLLECRLEDREQVDRVVADTRPSIVYHLAAQSSVSRSLADPAGTFNSNVMGSLNLLEALRSADSLKMAILISSAEVYGRVPEARMPICEEQEWCPTNPYSSSKACVELMGVQYYNTHGLPIVRMRPFNHIGAGQSETFVASSFAKQIAEIEGGLRPPQIVVGNLEAARDFTDVRDITRAYLLAADRCRVGDVYNLCSGKAVTIKSLLDGLLSLTNVSVEVAQDPARMRGSDVPVQVGSCAKFSEITGWVPEIPLEETLNDLLNYWRGVVCSGKVSG